MKRKLAKALCLCPVFLLLILAIMNDSFAFAWIEPNVIYIWLGIILLAAAFAQICDIIKGKAQLITIIAIKYSMVIIVCAFIGLMCFSATGGVSPQMIFAAVINFVTVAASIFLLVLEIKLGNKKGNENDKESGN